MVNVVLLVIVNKLLLQVVVNFLVRCNKIYYFNLEIDEMLLDMFDKDFGDLNKIVGFNYVIMLS